MTIDTINSLNREDFVDSVGWVFEDSPWVAERAWNHRPFATTDALHESMSDQVEAASTEEQLKLLRAHPDLGTRLQISDASVAEQTGAGLNQLTVHEFDQLRELNSLYKDKFGFPFLLAVKGSTKQNILEALKQRLQSEPETEFREALRQVHRIARFRIQDIVT